MIGFYNPPVVGVTSKDKAVIYKGAEERKNERLSYAYNISNNKDFVKMLLWENWALDINAMNWNKNWSYDKWICQFNSDRFLKIIKNPLFKEWKWQIDQCLILWKRWTPFYGIQHKRKFKNLLVFN